MDEQQQHVANQKAIDEILKTFNDLDSSNQDVVSTVYYALKDAGYQFKD